MIKQETYEINGHTLVKTYSDAGMKIIQDETGLLYDEAHDPAEVGRTYTESDEPIEIIETESDAEEIVGILTGEVRE